MTKNTTTPAATAARATLEVALGELARLATVLSDGVRYLGEKDGEMATLGALANREVWLRDLGAMLDGACATRPRRLSGSRDCHESKRRGDGQEGETGHAHFG